MTAATLTALCIELRQIIHNSTELDLNGDPDSKWWVRLAEADRQMESFGIKFELEEA